MGQGTIVDTPDGDWYGIIFQDRGGVGRVITSMPCRWLDGWPMLGDEDGKVPQRMRPVVSGQKDTRIVTADDFSNSKLDLCWQWNHNPINEAWSLTQRPGWLRLKTNRVVENLYLAPNTISQRMEGPTCSASVKLDVSHLKDGDCAGFAAFNGHSGVLTIKREGKRLSLSMSEQVVNLTDREKAVEKVEETVRETVPLDLKKAQIIWLRIDADFNLQQDFAKLFYSLDGETWTKIGPDYKMRFDYRKLFMGTRYAIFCYATKRLGGYLDVDEFNYKKE